MSRINPQPPTEGSESVSVEQIDNDTPLVEDFWLRIAREAYEDSSDWVDSNLREQWEKSISLFNSKHPPGSKYNTGAYEKRSRFFRPKTRTAVRNLQSAMAVAFFTNEDVLSVQPRNPNDLEQVAAAAVSQSIMQYRLTNTIPWFQTMSAALQDAAVQGVCISHQYWEYEEQEESYINVDNQNRPIMDESGSPVITKQKSSIKDKPVIELISPENIRIDPASHWHDPIESSPYVIHLIPMYIQDVRQKMEDGEWIDIPVEELLASENSEDDNTTRLVRDEPREDRLDNDAGYGDIDSYKIIWVHKNIIKKEGIDWCYYTAGVDAVLSEPKTLQEMYPWLRSGERPYVMGYTNVESHRIYPAGTVELTQELQAAANDIWNQRFDNVRLAMNKRYHIRRDRNIDLDALFRSVPGGAVEMDDPDADVRVIDTRDVTGSAYAEQDRINMDFDELQGNFSTSTVQGARSLNETVGGMSLMASNSGTVTEYVLRTFSETWVERVLKQLMRLEQYYETDAVILELAGDAAASVNEQFQGAVDDLLKYEVLLKVNVGISATDPLRKVQNLVSGIQMLGELPGFAQSLNVPEVVKEVFGQLGYKDGERFVNMEEDPRIAELTAQLEQMQMYIESEQGKLQNRLMVEQMKQQGNLEAANLKHGAEIRMKEMEGQLKYLDLQLKQEDVATRRAELMLQREALINQIADTELQRQEEMVAEGDVGVMARNDYNQIPYAVG
ncbi:MAG: portal protein [Acidimicrobiales bacterium]